MCLTSRRAYIKLPIADRMICLFQSKKFYWQAPLQDLSAFSKGQPRTLPTPHIGEKVIIGSRKELPRLWEQV